MTANNQSFAYKLGNIRCCWPTWLNSTVCYLRTFIFVNDRTRHETQLSLTNRATHLCKCNGVADLKTRLSRHMLPCRIWLVCVKGCRHKYRRTPQSGRSGTQLCWDGRRGRPQDTHFSHTCVTTSNSVVLWQRKRKRVKVHSLDIAPLRSESPPQKRSGMARLLKGSHSFTCTPTRSSTIGMSHTCLCLPSYGWYSFLPTPEGWRSQWSSDSMPD